MRIIRPKSDVRHFAADDLDRLAELWLRLHDLSPSTQNQNAEHFLTLNVHSTPRSQRPMVQRILEERLRSHEFHANEHADPDTCSVCSSPEPINTFPIHGLGIVQLQGTSIDELTLEIRLTTRAYERRQVLVEATLVMIGQIVDGTFHLRAIWGCGAFPDSQNQLYQATPWPHEQEFWKAFEDLQNQDLRETPEVIKLAKSLFITKSEDRKAHRVQQLLLVPIDGKPRTIRLLMRFLGLSAIPVFMGVLFHLLGQVDLHLGYLEPLLLLLGSCPLLLWLWFESRIFLALGRAMRAQSTALLSSEPRFESASENLIAEVLARSEPRKTDADLRELGFQLTGHIQLKAALESRCLISVYHLPANPHLNLLAYSLIDEQTGIGNARFYCWPANVTLQSFTRYTNGFIAVLSNLGQGWRRKSTTEDCVTRYRPDLTQPTDLISVHEQECDQFEHRTGQIPVSCTRIPDLLAWLNDWKHQEYEYFRKTPFSLGDWINLWLQRVRSAHRH